MKTTPLVGNAFGNDAVRTLMDRAICAQKKKRWNRGASTVCFTTLCNSMSLVLIQSILLMLCYAWLRIVAPARRRITNSLEQPDRPRPNPPPNLFSQVLNGQIKRVKRARLKPLLLQFANRLNRRSTHRPLRLSNCNRLRLVDPARAVRDWVRRRPDRPCVARLHHLYVKCDLSDLSPRN